MKHFWTNTIWFLLLGILTIILLVYVLVKADNRKLMFGLFLSFSGIVFLIEVPILLIFKGYEYFPMIVDKVSRLDDSIIGNHFSQYSLAATALLIAFFKLKPYWYILCALLYGGIEELFLYLGIYKQYWYRTWMTVVGFSILFLLLKMVYQKTVNGPGRTLKYILVNFAIYTPLVNVISLLFRITGHPVFNKNLLSDESRSIAVCALINFIFLSNTIMVAYYKKLRWQYHAAIITIFCIAYFVAYAFNIIILSNIWWLLVFITSQILGMYLCLIFIDRLYDNAKRTA